MSCVSTINIIIRVIKGSLAVFRGCRGLFGRWSRVWQRFRWSKKISHVMCKYNLYRYYLLPQITWGLRKLFGSQCHQWKSIIRNKFYIICHVKDSKIWSVKLSYRYSWMNARQFNSFFNLSQSLIGILCYFTCFVQIAKLKLFYQFYKSKQK